MHLYKVQLIAAVAAALALFTFLSPVVTADNIEWTDPVDGDFDDSTNWTVTSGGGTPPPAAGDSIFLNEAGTYSVTLTQDEAADFLRATSGTVSLLSESATVRTLDLTTGLADLSVRGDGTLNIGSASNSVVVNVGDRLEVAHGAGGGAGTLNLAGASTVLDVLGVTTHNFGISGQVARVNVSDGAFLGFAAGSTLAIGRSGTSASDGRFTITDAVMQAGNIDIATLDSGAFGSVAVSGDGAGLSQIGTSTINVGSNTGGIGELTIDDQASVGTQVTNINPTGRVTVGSGAKWNVDGPLTLLTGGELTINDATINANGGLDNSADGTLNLDSGALNVSGGAFVPSSGGDFTVGEGFELTLGNGATTDVTGQLVVTSFSQTSVAKLTITDGAQATSQSGLIDGGATLLLTDPAPTAVVEGNGSSWDIAGDLRVGNNLGAKLVIDNGATVSNQFGAIGKDVSVGGGLSTLPASVDVSGAGSSWTSTEGLLVGELQRSKLTIRDQASVVVDASVDLAARIGFGGLVEVDGSGSLLDINGGLLLFSGATIPGDNNQPSQRGVVVTNGGSVEVDSATLLTNALESQFGQRALLRVEGSGSSFSVAGHLAVGEFNGDGGSGNLLVADGGLATTGSAAVGFVGEEVEGSHTRRALVSGSGSVWNNTGDLAIGGDLTTAGGTGEVVLENAGLLDVGGALTIWALGTLTLDDGTLRLDSSLATLEGTVAFNSGTLILTDAAGYTVGSGAAFVEDLIGDTQVVLFPGQKLQIEQTLTVPTGATITQLDGQLAANTLVNDGLINANGTTITTTAGLDNSAQLVLIDATVEGPVDNAAGAAITVLGSVDFNGPVTGPGGFFGPGVANFNGVVSLGASPAEVAFEGGVTLGDTSELIIELAGDANGEFDRLVVGGDLTFGGDLRVELLDGYMPELGDVFEFAAAAGEVLGQFDDELLPDLGSLLELRLAYADDTASLVVLPSLQGDYNADGTVNIADYTVWRNTLGATGIALLADGDQDGDVDADDYQTWRNNFGNQTPAAISSADSAVPEPQAAMLLLAAIVLSGASKQLIASLQLLRPDC